MRAQRDEDEAFLATLFAAVHAPALALPGLTPAMIHGLVAMQYRGQTESYRARFPDARRVILEHDGRPVGRLLVEREERDLYVVDIAVSPDVRNRGFGAAAVAVLQREAATTGLGVRALVSPENGPSLAMFRRRGFVGTGRFVGPSLELRWAP